MAGVHPTDGIAIIADLSGRQDKYLVGQTVGESGAVLEEVHSDRVILRFNGRQETLKRFKPAPMRAPPGTALIAGSPPAPIMAAATCADHQQPAAGRSFRMDS